MKGKRDGLQDLDNNAVPVVKARKKSEFWRAICRKMDLILRAASAGSRGDFPTGLGPSEVCRAQKHTCQVSETFVS